MKWVGTFEDIRDIRVIRGRSFCLPISVTSMLDSSRWEVVERQDLLNSPQLLI